MMVFSISLLALLVWAEQDVPPKTAPLVHSAESSPFAYVREDGTEVYLDHIGSALPRPEPGFHTLSAMPNLEAAVHSWSSPVILSSKLK
jgi:hypothetical protein